MLSVHSLEIEIGSHFVTIYGHVKDRSVIIRDLATAMYEWFIEFRPELRDIQQKNFTHEPGDPGVYHTDGDPSIERPDNYPHFHIRFGRQPTEEDVFEVTEKLLDLVGDYDLTILSIENLCEKDRYPIDRPTKDNYLDWLDEVRRDYLDKMGRL